MTALSSRLSLPALAVMAGLAGFAPAPLAAQAVSNSAEFEAWRKVQKEDVDGMRDKFLALAKAVPADKHGWRPMEGSRSFHQVFAHVAAEGNLEAAMFGGLKGFRFDYSLIRKRDNVQLSGFGYGAISKGELFSILYMAPRLHFFPMYSARADQIGRSAVIKE